MIRRLLTRLGVLAADDDRWASEWCEHCGWYMPLGHKH